MSDNEVKDYQEKKAIVNAPLRWTDLRLSEQVKTIRFFRDKDNNIIAMPVVLLDPTQTGLNILPMGRVGISDPGAVNSYARVFGLPCCGWPETTMGLVTHSTEMVQKGANLEAVRTPTTFMTVDTAIAAATVVWAPAAGFRFRLLGGVISFGGPAIAAAAANIINFRDENTNFGFDFAAWTPTVAVPTPHIAFDLRPNGYLSLVTNNRLRVLQQHNYVTGSIRITVWGTEEV